jgi:XRE family transcriptional regulator, regulator of sulfur utilization
MARPSPESRQLGAAIRELRERHALSCEQLAARAGMSARHLTAIERGAVDPTFLTLVRLAHGAGVPLSELAGLLERG